MIDSRKESKPTLPETRDVNLAEIASSQLGAFIEKAGKNDFQFSLKHKNGKDEVEFILTPAIVKLIFKTIVHIAKGDAVTIVPFHAELTTQEAANFLNISRPYLIKLLEKNLIPFHKVGRHRRILFSDVLKYKEKSKEKSSKTREELTKEAQELDLGY